MNKDFLKKHMKELIIGGSIIIATIILCRSMIIIVLLKIIVKKVYKDYIKKGFKEATAAIS